MPGTEKASDKEGNASDGVRSAFDTNEVKVGKTSTRKSHRTTTPNESRSQGKEAKAAPPEYETRGCYFNLNSHISERDLCMRDKDALHKQLGCAADETVAFPTGRRLVDSGRGSPGLWEQLGETRCVAPDEPSAGDLQAAVEAEFARLPITPAPITIQPGAGWTFVNVPTIVHSASDTQLLTTELLDTPVEVEVTPAGFSWNFDDETPALATNDPGGPYPHHTIDHTYVRIGTAQITLTTTWTGQFRPNDSGPWLPITGTATTTTAAPTLEIREATARLVEDPLN